MSAVFNSESPGRPGSRRYARGVSLIELMVALTIGAVLIFGATQAYVDSRRIYGTNEVAARLQETARYAFGVIEPDVRMANYWGLVKGAGWITGQTAQTAGTAGTAGTCGAGYAQDLMLNLDGSNNAYRRNTALTFACAAGGGGAVDSADTLTVRRAAVTAGAAGSTRLQVCSNRISGQLVADSTSCIAAPNGQINDLIVNTYYVARNSAPADNNGFPALRRWTLGSNGGAPAILSEEVIPGVEDMQVQFGLDPAGSSGRATRYVNPGAIPASAQVVSVRVWLLIRAENRETGFTDGRTYTYGDRTGTTPTSDLNATGAGGQPYRPNDGFRRLLVSRTIQIRNALGT